MPEVKKVISIFGHETEVSEVPIVKSDELWAVLTLEDGSVIKVKSVPTSVLRIEGQKNPLDGSPIYMVLATPVVANITPPERLGKKVQ
jgi:hypothetical protein